MRIAPYGDGYWNLGKSETTHFVDTVRTHLETVLERRNIDSITLWGRGRSKYNLEKSKTKFHIFVGGGLETLYGFQSPLPMMWGIETGFRGCDCGNMHTPSGQGLLVIEPKSKIPVAELIGNDLFILVNLNDRNHLDSRRSGQILGKILEEVVALLGGSFPSLRRLESGEFVLPKALEVKRHQQLLLAARQDLKAGVASVSSLQQQADDLSNQTPQANRVLERIAGIPEIKDVAVKGRKIIITTHVMYGLHPRTEKIHEYGQFRIQLTFGKEEDAESSVTFRNLDRRPYVEGEGNYGHPHVDRGEARFWCQGEGKAINALISSFEYEAAILFALKAIESVNASPQGNYLQVLSAFPIVEERKPYPKTRAAISAETEEAFARIFATDGEAVKSLQEQLAGKIKETQGIKGRLARLLLEQAIQKAAQSAGSGKNPNAEITQLMRQRIEAVKKLPGVNSVQILNDSLSIKLDDTDVSFNFATGEILLRNKEPFPVSELWMTLPELFGELEWETAVTLIQEALAESEEEALEEAAA